MTYRSVASAEQALYGSRSHCMGVTHYPPNGPDNLKDLAQSWIDGDTEKCLAAERAHRSEVRARVVIVKCVPMKIQIVRLRGLGWRTREIAAKVGCHTGYVARVCRALPRIARRSPRRWKIDLLRLQSLRSAGMTLKQIAKECQLHYSTVSRVLRGKQ